VSVTDYAIAFVTDYVEAYVDTLLSQFRKPRIEGLLSALLTEVQKADDVYRGLYTGANLDDATNHLLDLVGAWLGVPRYGLSDDDYRLRLRVEIAILLSNGTMPDLIAVTRAALANSLSVRYELLDVVSATVRVRLTGAVSSTFPAKLLAYLNRARALGVRILVEWSAYDESETFTFSATDSPVTDTGRGCGDSTNPATGGYFSGVV
jgi:hypothetical protein